MNYRIHDRSGKSYSVETDVIDNCIRFLVRGHPPTGQLIGHANLWNYGDGEMELREIMIGERVFQLNPNPFTRIFRRGEWVDFRGRKLGQALLDCVTAHLLIRRLSKVSDEGLGLIARNGK